MPEIWDVYDENRIKKPYTHVRGEPLRPGDRHLVVEIWTFAPDGRVLLTLRHPDKHYGGLWECTGGSALAGEDSLTAVRRELLEETGLSMGDVLPTLLCTATRRDAFIDIYAVQLPFALEDIRLQPGETVDARLEPISFLDAPGCETCLPPPICERLRASRPLLHRFLRGDERWDMYDHSCRFLGYNRLRPVSKAEQQLPWEASSAAIALIQALDGRLLLTRRAPHKAAGGQWSCGAGGGVLSGETPLQAVCREAREEVGLSFPESLPRLLDRQLLDGDYGKWFMHIYLVRTRFALTDLRLQAEEVSDAKLVSPDELLDYPMVSGLLRRNPAILTTLRQL